MLPSLHQKFHDKSLDGLQFCRLVYDHFEEVLQESGGTEKLRARRRPEKALLEELFPICRYIQTYYGPGQYLSVRWLDGNQHYDAKIVSTGALVDYGDWPAEGTLEVTQAVHPNEYLMRERLNSDGGAFGLDGLTRVIGQDGVKRVASEPTSYHNKAFIEEMAVLIITAISAKAEIMARGKYPPDTTLIVDCVLTTIFHPEEWEAMIAGVKARLPRHGFIRIFMTASSGRFITAFD